MKYKVMNNYLEIHENIILIILKFVFVIAILFSASKLLLHELFRNDNFSLSSESSPDLSRSFWTEELVYVSSFSAPTLQLWLCTEQPSRVWLGMWTGCPHRQILVEFDQDKDGQHLTAHWHGNHEIDVTVPAKVDFETRRERLGDIVLHYRVAK